MMVKRVSMRLGLVCGLLGGLTAVSLAQTYTPPPPPLTTLPPCPLGKDGKPLPKKKQKDCDPTVYPPEKVESKDKKTADANAAGSTTPPPTTTPAAQQFPFPGEQPTTSADTPSAKAFPYPGEKPAQSLGQYPGQIPGESPQASDVQHDPAAEKKAAETPAGKSFPFPGGGTPDMPVDPDMPAVEKRDPSAPASSSSSSSSTPETGTDPVAGANADSATAPGPKGEYDDDDSTAPPVLKDKGRGKNAVGVSAPQI